MVKKSPLLVFSDDWGRHPSSCQHLISHLVKDREVHWVNTIGTRAPRLDWPTVRRGIGKIKQWWSSGVKPSAQPDNLHILSPKMWPWFRSRFDRWLNRKLLTNHLVPYLAGLPEPPIAVTTVPIVADILGDLPVRRWVYYCVDDFSQWPGLDQAAMARMEIELLGKVDEAVAVSVTLQGRMAKLGCASTLLTHGVDLEFWRKPAKAPGGSLEQLERPLILFFGLIDGRLDIAFLKRLGQSLNRGTILLVGPQDPTAPDLYKVPRLKILPARPLDELPAIAQEASVLIMPYADLPVTRAMQPLKLKEYLATGKPAIVRDLPANREWSDCLDLCETPEVFAELVENRLMSGLPEVQRESRRRLSEEAWGEKALAFLRMISPKA